MSEEKTVVINEAEVKQEEKPMTEETLREEGVSEQEIAIAKKHGMLKEEKDEHEEQSESKTGEVDDDKAEQSGSEEDAGKPDAEKKTEESEVKEPSSFEEMEENFEKQPKVFHKYTPNSKALYWRWKRDKEQRQEAQTKLDEVTKKLEFEGLRDKGALSKLEKIRKRLAKPEDLTVEELQAVIDGAKDAPTDVKETTDDKPLTKKDLEAIEAKKQEEQKHYQAIQSRIIKAEEYGKANYENFEQVVKLAQEVTQSKPAFLNTLNQALVDKNISEPELVELVVDIAKVHHEYGKSPKAKEGNGKLDVDRMAENAKKQKTSASVGGGRGRRVVTYDDLTSEDVVNMNQNDYNKLPREVRDRLLKGS